MSMRWMPLIAWSAILLSPAFAGETPWQNVGPDVNIRLISAGEVTAEKTAWFGLEIDMPPDTKTYWRVPGDTGLPTALELADTRHVSALDLRWPYPEIDQTPEYLDYAYFGHTVLPFRAHVVETEGNLDVSATLGICSDICVPVKVSFALPLQEAAPDMPNGLRIRQALADVPMKWQDTVAPVSRVTLAPGGDVIEVHLQGSPIDHESLILSAPDGEPLFGTPQKSPQPGLLVLPILGKTDNIALLGLDVQLTFMTERGAFELDRTIQAGE